MKTKGLLRIVVLFFCVIGFSGCNDDESEFSSTEIQQALFDMKGCLLYTSDAADD